MTPKKPIFMSTGQGGASDPRLPVNQVKKSKRLALDLQKQKPKVRRIR